VFGEDARIERFYWWREVFYLLWREEFSVKRDGRILLYVRKTLCEETK
jgi:hypothetical protein